MLTARGRQERAYAKYVRKMSHRRDRFQAKMMKSRMRVPDYAPSEPRETTELGGSPQSMTSGNSEPASADAPAPASADAIASADGSN